MDGVQRCDGSMVATGLLSGECIYSSQSRNRKAQRPMGRLLLNAVCLDSVAKIGRFRLGFVRYMSMVFASMRGVFKVK